MAGTASPHLYASVMFGSAQDSLAHCINAATDPGSVPIYQLAFQDVIQMSIFHAIMHMCRTLYGFGEINSMEQYAERLRKPVKQGSLQVRDVALAACISMFDCVCQTSDTMCCVCCLTGPMINHSAYTAMLLIIS